LWDQFGFAYPKYRARWDQCVLLIKNKPAERARRGREQSDGFGFAYPNKTDRDQNGLAGATLLNEESETLARASETFGFAYSKHVVRKVL
jgi:hypothetical protein